MERSVNQRIHINLATEQAKALKLRWSDPEVIMGVTMLLAVGGVVLWIIW